jgi:hypothetical protein
MNRYFAHISAAGPIRYGQFPFAIGVLEALDKPMPIGMASEIGRTEGGLETGGPGCGVPRCLAGG